MAELGRHAAAKGRRIVGWDEILDAEVPGDAVVMSWRGSTGALAAARAGHDAILAPAPDFYMDNRQSASDREPSGRGLVIGWQRLHDFDAGLGALDPKQRAHILGLQVNLWTEHVRTPEYATLMLWPRAAILAELAWSGKRRNWKEFGPVLLGEMDRQARLGHASSRVALEPDLRLAADATGHAVATIEQPAGIGVVRYTTDGSTPGAKSAVYSAPLRLPPGTRLRAVAMLGQRVLGQPREWQIGVTALRSAKGNELPSCNPGVDLRMEDDAPTSGRRKVHLANIFETCWIWKGALLDGATRLRAEVVRRPFNFELAHDIGLVKVGDAQTAAGELVVRLGDCAGREVARLPLGPVGRRGGVNPLEGALLQRLQGTGDLCIAFVRPKADPMWVLDRVTLLP